MPKTKKPLSRKPRAARKKPVLKKLLRRISRVRLRWTWLVANSGALGLILGALVLGLGYMAYAEATSATPEIRSGLVNKCLDDFQNGVRNGNLVDSYGCNGTGAQHWVRNPDGTVRLDGKCLDVYRSAVTDGAAVDLFTCNGDASQKWNYDARHELVGAQSGKCLEVVNGSVVNVTPVQIRTCSGGVEQEWYMDYFRRVSPPKYPTPLPSVSRTPMPTPIPSVAPLLTSCDKPLYTVPMSTTNTQSGMSLGGYYLSNDTWNSANYSVAQTMYLCSAGSFNVVANMNDSNGDGAVKTYPNVHQDFNEQMLSSYHTIQSTFGESAPHVGTYEYAYDVWLNGVKTSKSTELMIWTDNFGQTPAGTKVATVTIEGQTYAVWKNGSYIAFVDTQNVTSGSLNLLAFFNYATYAGWMPAGATLGQIDYGAELVSTGGSPATFKVTNFSITTN